MCTQYHTHCTQRRADPSALRRLRVAAERAKVALSSANQVDVCIQGLLPPTPEVDAAAAAFPSPEVRGAPASGVHLSARVTRAQLEEATAPLQARLVRLLAALGADTHVSWAER